MKISSFDRWVNDNNISNTFEYAKGWWDYIELVRRFALRLNTEDVRVIGHYVVDTPSPCEQLPMPAVAIATPGVMFALRYDFGSWSLKHPRSTSGSSASNGVHPTRVRCSDCSIRLWICG